MHFDCAAAAARVFIVEMVHKMLTQVTVKALVCHQSGAHPGLREALIMTSQDKMLSSGSVLTHSKIPDIGLRLDWLSLVSLSISCG